MDVIPVLDLLNGVVVRGVAGQRDKYRPIQSALTSSPDPSLVMKALTESFHLQQFYIADLDAIQYQQLNRCVIAELSRGHVRLLVDRGVRTEGDAEELLELGADQVVVALETLSGPLLAKRLVKNFGAERLVASLDLRASQLLTPCQAWKNETPLQVARELAACGFRQLIVLDLASVGTDAGVSTLELCLHMRAILPEVRLITGGGVRCAADLQELQLAGIEAALVASALHDGRLTAEDLRNLKNTAAS